ncbi:hypothetical protein Vretifemale_5661 [Volvox reticuliferus]|uniref:Glutamine amidotransferase type-2 domain-containing protein n=1 Tax=Volvox reticuliferus TaxID=1737510 RepID=A0A8J4C738_9CHLO|nr:hypothetical protein Vretifemale_5661 [Volvox reticuliferus]
MCGIAFACVSNGWDPAISGNGNANNNSTQTMTYMEWLAALRSRGPDFLGSQSVEVRDVACRLQFIASLLQLRGIKPGRSPGVSADGHILCFNGEVFGGLDVPPGENDAACLLAALAEADPLSVPVAISRLRGPWALLFWDPIRRLLWFGRDVLGRRSLLVHFPSAADPRLLLSSVSELSKHPSSPAAGCGPAASAASSIVGVGAACGAAAESPENVDAAAFPRYAAAGGSDGGDASTAGETDAEPSGSDGYWTELPPGLYSISFATPPKLQKEFLEPLSKALGNPQTEISVGATAAPVDLDAQVLTREAREQSAVFRRLAIGAFGLTLERHTWRDPLLLQLESYVRAESASRRRSPTTDVASEVVPAAVRAATAGGMEAACNEGVDGGEKQHHQVATTAVPKGAGAAECFGGKEILQCLIPEATLAGLEPPPRALSRCWGHLSLAAGGPNEVLVHALLRALLAAMRVRCACIETRSPHPAAAYAAALTARSGAAVSSTPSPPQPSWRSDNPLDFSLALGEDLPAQRDAVATVCSGGGGGGGDGGSDSGPWITWDITGKDGCIAASGGGPGEASGPVGPRFESMASRVAPIMILFSGGVDSVLLAALAHQVLPLGVPIGKRRAPSSATLRTSPQPPPLLSPSNGGS